MNDDKKHDPKDDVTTATDPAPPGQTQGSDEPVDPPPPGQTQGSDDQGQG
jgi:hypothetical protein